MLPASLKAALQEHLQKVRGLHERDLREGRGRVYLPYALSRKYPRADREWGWQYVFPAPDLSVDPRTGETRRHHLHERRLLTFQEAVHKARVVKPATCHTLRHSFASKSEGLLPKISHHPGLRQSPRLQQGS